MLNIILAIALVLGPIEMQHKIEALSQTSVKIQWITDPATTYLNVWRLSDNTIQFVGNATGGLTSTLVLTATEGTVFQIQEYKLVDNVSLELVRFFNTNPTPAFEMKKVFFPIITNEDENGN